MQTHCPCGTQQRFEQCCQPFLTFQLPAPTPEKLMRSRYCAFVLQNAQYLIATHAEDSRPADLTDQLQQSFATTQWLSLRILAAPAANSDFGEVEFVAFFRGSNSTIDQIHERSQFAKNSSNWFYLKGQHLAPIKLERNSPCPCGSGKKYKKCCGS